jgi:putative ABC transport system permease protein
MDSLSEAAAAVAHRPIRALLTALGTILGVGAFVATTGLVETAKAQVSVRFDALKATEVRVQDAAPDGTSPFPPDVDERLQNLNGVNEAGLLYNLTNVDEVTTRALASVGHSSHQPIPLVAATPGGLRATLPTVSSGALFESFHERRGEHVALLGRVAASGLGIRSVTGHPVVFIGGVSYSVIGILGDVGRNPDLLLSVVIPHSTASSQFGGPSQEAEVLIDTALGAAQLIGRQASLTLRPQNPDRLRILVPPDPSTLRNSVESDVESLFYAISALALLIGAVAITNATLLNVIERRPEIGLRRSQGATRGHIGRQITLEAALLGTMAGIVGTTVGVVAISLGSIAREWTPTMRPSLLVVAPIVGVLTGTVAGLLPAFKASRTPPAETLKQ